MHLYTEAKHIAQDALEQVAQYGGDASDYIHQDCDSHECVILYHRAIRFCADHNTNAGEEWLEDCGGIAQPGDSFGQIACRIAFATLYCAAMDALAEMESEYEDA